MRHRLIGGTAALLLSLVALVTAQQAPAPRPVDDAALARPEARNQDWLSYGRDYYEQRFSPLDQITDANAAQLGLAASRPRRS
jgi:quinohemoprotein ethanol dehydrogenase